jgi:mono/diheme cytochrome c family protein
MRIAALMMCSWLLPTAQPAPPSALPPATGNVARGKTLFTQTYRCYACHGYRGETGIPRLVPTLRTQEGFVAYIRKPATPGMPSYAHAPMQDLTDIYAYVRSIRPDAPPLESIPLLTDISKRRTKRP